MGPIHAWEHNLLGKMFPTFCPMGTALVTRDEVPDPNHLRLTTRLNGKTMQSANTDDLVFNVAAHRVLLAVLPLPAGRRHHDRLAERRRLRPQPESLHARRRRDRG